MEIGRRIGGGKTLPPSLFSLDGLPLWAERFFWLGVLDLGQGGGGRGLVPGKEGGTRDEQTSRHVCLVVSVCVTATVLCRQTCNRGGDNG